MFLSLTQPAGPGGQRDIDRGAEPAADEVVHQRDPHRTRLGRHHPHHNLHLGKREERTAADRRIHLEKFILDWIRKKTRGQWPHSLWGHCPLMGHRPAGPGGMVKD